YFELSEEMPYYGAFFDKDVTDFYSWSISKDDRLIIGSAIPTGTDIKQRFEILKQKLQERGFRWGALEKSEGSFINRPKSFQEIQLGKNNLCLLGEAAGFISPSSAEGISYALKSARFLAQSINQGLPHYQLRYKKLCRPLYLSIFSKWLKSPGMYNSILRNGIIKSGIASVVNSKNIIAEKKSQGTEYSSKNLGIYPSLALKY
nr:hypothetical protein [Spirochaetaceae bacterium]